MATPLQIGVVGCGNISGIYFQNLTAYRGTTVVACSDLETARAEAAAEKYGVPQVLSTRDLLASPDVELVLNLTIPNAHASVAMAAIEAGKHVYNEKPLAIDFEDGKQILEKAEAKRVRVGCAPDTFLGAGIQTCRQLIDEGAIGEPIACEAHMQCHGHEGWHPAPEFYYQKGGGPMLDMGPYYLTALATLMGGFKRVAGISRTTFPTRTITSQPQSGKVFDVETPTHIAGTIEFQSGAIGMVVQSFDVWFGDFAPLIVHGTEGSLLVGDPNSFGDAVSVRKRGEQSWSTVPLEKPFAQNSRGLGVLDIAHAIQSGRPHRASGELALHVLEAMQAFNLSSEESNYYHMETQITRPESLRQDEFAADLA